MKLTRLTELRWRVPLSQKELAARAGISRLQVWRIENLLADPHPRTIRKLARALHVRPEDLMTPNTQAQEDA